MIRRIPIAGLNDVRMEMDSRSHFSPFGLGPQETLAYRKRFRGMISVASKIPLKDRSVLSLLYTPGVAAPCLAIARDPLPPLTIPCAATPSRCSLMAHLLSVSGTLVQ